MGEMTSYEPGQFSWVDLMAGDLGEAKTFYGSLFGWEPVDQDTQGGPPYVIFRLNGKQVAGMGQLSDEMRSNGVPPCWNSYVNVEDVDAIVAKVPELGGRVTMPPMTVLDAGKMAGLQDPTGGHVFVWQKDRHFGAELVNDPHAFCWNELATRDLAKAKEFFGALFGWEFTQSDDSPAEYDVIQCGGRENGGIMQMTEEWGEIPPHWSVYFTVEDTEATVAKVQELGGSVRVPPFDTPVGKMAVVADPHGAGFSVIAMSVSPD